MVLYELSVDCMNYDPCNLFFQNFFQLHMCFMTLRNNAMKINMKALPSILSNINDTAVYMKSVNQLQSDCFIFPNHINDTKGTYHNKNLQIIDYKEK